MQLSIQLQQETIMQFRKFVVATALSGALAVNPAVAQVAPYNPTLRAAPPVLKAEPRQETETEARNRRLGTALFWGALGALIYLATKDRKSSTDDNPTWTSQGQGKEPMIWLPPQARPTVEPPPPPAPAINRFYE